MRIPDLFSLHIRSLECIEIYEASSVRNRSKSSPKFLTIPVSASYRISTRFVIKYSCVTPTRSSEHDSHFFQSYDDGALY